MPERDATTRLRTWLVAGLMALHAGLFAVGGALGWIEATELFNLLMLAGNLGGGVMLLRRRDLDLVTGAGCMILILAHAFVGIHMAPDHLTSGAVLLANLLVLYVGVRINRHLPARHWIVFVAGYFALYAIFVLCQRNAEPLFILFLLAFAACARSLRLTAYFWAAVLSFTFCQPFAWESLMISFFILTAVLGARGPIPSTTARLFLLTGLVLLFLVLLPVIMTVTGEDLRNIAGVLGDPRIRDALATTLWTATLSTGVLVLFGVPLAYAVSRLRFPGRTLLLSLADLPIIIPQSAAGLALVHIFGRQQPLGRAIQELTGVPVDGTLLGICVAQVFVAMPFLVRSAVAAFDAVPADLELAARTLGSSSAGAFLRIACPLASRGILLGAVLAWARAAGEFGAILFIAPTPETAPVAAYNRFNAAGMAETGPLVAALLLFSLAMFFLLQLGTRLLPSQHGKEDAP